ncbi:MAG: hypothetical protein H6739_31580 [Alphaproteobacteria bacterium]|nr:hypothetical protein [Alphaproteobacteria bacterium]
MLALLLTLLLLVAPAHATTRDLDLPLRDPQAAATLTAVFGDQWTGGVERTRYDDKWYDEIALAKVPEGYLPLISGEGGQDVPQDLIGDVIFRRFEQLPQQSGWVKHVENLGGGYDPVLGADYQDTAFLLDSVFMYVAFIWRIHRVEDDLGRTVLWFEKLSPEAVTPQVWDRYQRRVAAIHAQTGRRWVANAIVEPAVLYGAFVVEPGQVHASRVTFAAHLVFGPDDSWLAAYATRLPFVLRLAIGEVFNAAVRICLDELAVSP